MLAAFCGGFGGGRGWSHLAILSFCSSKLIPFHTPLCSLPVLALTAGTHLLGLLAEFECSHLYFKVEITLELLDWPLTLLDYG